MSYNKNGKSFFTEVLKGIITTVTITLVAVLIFAWIVKTASLGVSVIKAVNQFIKVISIFLGCFFSLSSGKGLIKGAIVGGISAIITYLIFALIGGELVLGVSFIIDLIFCIIVGGICGIISVNVKKQQA